MYNFFELLLWGKRSNMYKNVSLKREHQIRKLLVLTRDDYSRLVEAMHKKLPEAQAVQALDVVIECMRLEYHRK